MKMGKMELGLAVVLLVSAANAQAGREGGNGGDMCEDRIKTIRDDIASWIERGGSAGLKLPSGISLGQYNGAMLAAISKSKISCTEEKVMIGSAEKTCSNFIDSTNTPQIVCNAERFMKETSDSDQYVLTHHEYAGVAGFETNKGEESQYPISNQISEFLQDEVIKKLGVQPAAPIHATSPGNVEELKRRCGKSIDSIFETVRAQQAAEITSVLNSTGEFPVRKISVKYTWCGLFPPKPLQPNSDEPYTHVQCMKVDVVTVNGLHLVGSTVAGMMSPTFTVQSDNAGRPLSASCHLPNDDAPQVSLYQLLNADTYQPIFFKNPRIIYATGDNYNVFGGFFGDMDIFKDVPVQGSGIIVDY